AADQDGFRVGGGLFVWGGVLRLSRLVMLEERREEMPGDASRGERCRVPGATRIWHPVRPRTEHLSSLPATRVAGRCLHSLFQHPPRNQNPSPQRERSSPLSCSPSSHRSP